MYLRIGSVFILQENKCRLILSPLLKEKAFVSIFAHLKASLASDLSIKRMFINTGGNHSAKSAINKDFLTYSWDFRDICAIFTPFLGIIQIDF